MKKYPKLCAFLALFLSITLVLIIIPVHAEITEKDIGIPFYPGSRQIPNCDPLVTEKNYQSFLNINFITSDSFKKVLVFYQEKLGKFSIFKSHASVKSALWTESVPKGYRIVNLVETHEGTRITITKRNW